MYACDDCSSPGRVFFIILPLEALHEVGGGGGVGDLLYKAERRDETSLSLHNTRGEYISDKISKLAKCHKRIRRSVNWCQKCCKRIRCHKRERDNP